MSEKFDSFTMKPPHFYGIWQKKSSELAGLSRSLAKKT